MVVFNLISPFISVLLQIDGGDSTAFLLICFLIALALICFSFAAIFMRLHDIGVSGWHNLFGLIPIVKLSFLTARLFGPAQ